MSTPLVYFERIWDAATSLVGDINTSLHTVSPWMLLATLGGVCLVALALKWWVSARRFSRGHPPYGYERFKSYANMLACRFFEGVASLVANVSFAACVCIVGFIGARHYIPRWIG